MPPTALFSQERIDSRSELPQMRHRQQRVRTNQAALHSRPRLEVPRRSASAAIKIGTGQESSIVTWSAADIGGNSSYFPTG